MANLNEELLDFTYKKLDPRGQSPEKNDRDAGWDIKCIADEDFQEIWEGYLGEKQRKGVCFELGPGERKPFRTGIAIELPDGYHGLLWPRSGLDIKSGIGVRAGLIDNAYRGELIVCLQNDGKKTACVCGGDRICQMIIIKENEGYFREVKELTETSRHDKGFGSSGR